MDVYHEIKITQNKSIRIHDNWIHYGVVIGAILGVIFLFVVVFTPHSYTIDVRNTNWEWNVYIQEYKTEHKTDRSTYPSDAYNVTRHHHTHEQKRIRMETNIKSHIIRMIMTLICGLTLEPFVILDWIMNHVMQNIR